MSNRAQVLQKLHPIGSNVKVVMKNKDEYQGTVLEHGDDYLIIRHVTGDESFISYDDIGSSRKLEPNTSEKRPLLTPPSAFVPIVDAKVSESEHVIKNMPVVFPSQIQEVQMPNLDAEAVKRLHQVQQRFDDDTLSPKIDVRLPDFVFPAEELSGLEAKKEWERIENMYNYARKMNELSSKYNRIQLITSGLKELCEKYPSSPTLKRQVIYFLLLTEKVSEALKYCTQVALTSSMSSDWRNVAALAMKVEDSLQACCALDEFFKQNTITDDLEVWYLYVSLMRILGDYSLLARFLDATRRKLRSEEKQLLLETGIYVLLSTNREQIAQKVMYQQLKGTIIDTLVQDVCNHLKGTSGEAYRRVISDLNDTREQKKKESLPTWPQQSERTAGEIYQRATTLANDEGDYFEALSELRQLWKLDPKYPGTQELYERWRYAREVGAPKGSKPFARAKRLQLIEKNYDRAIALFYQAIARNDKNTESAVKDLSSLLMQLDRPKDAVSVMVKYRKKVRDQQAIDNMLVAAYKKMEQYDQAIEILSRCITNATLYGQRMSLLWQMGNCYLRKEDYISAEKWFREVLELENSDKRDQKSNDNKGAQRNLAFCLIKQNCYDEAEQILRSILPDMQADELLKAVAEARLTGQAAQIEADDVIIDAILDSSSEMSSFVRFFLDRCEYEGVPSDRIQEKKFDYSDVQKLDIVAARLGARRPRERAEYYLSAAKIVSELADEEWDNKNQMYKFLCRSFTSRGDEAVLENKPLEMIRECYCEALSAYDRSRNEISAVYALVRYLFSLLGHSQIPMTSDIPSVDETLEKIFSLQPQKEKVFDAIAYLVFRSMFATRSVLKCLYEKPEFQEMAREYLKGKGIIGLDGASGKDVFVQQWIELKNRNAEGVLIISAELDGIAKVELTTASVENSLQRIRAIEYSIFFELDQQRVRELQRILEMILDFSKQFAFEEQERFSTQIVTRCQNLLVSIEKEPTTLSVEVLYSTVKTIQEKIAERLTKIYESSVPKLNLRLAIESYSPNDNQKIEVQIVVENQMGCSPAESLELEVETDEGFFTVSTQKNQLDGSLRGGTQVILYVPIYVTEQALRSQAFSLPICARYRIRSDERQQILNKNLPVRLNVTGQFEHIDNPYAAYASGGIVGEEEMFYGRTELISRVAEAICNTSFQGQSMLIFGQKRSGKSSILYHLKKRLEKYTDLLVLDIGNIGALLDDQASVPLHYMILWRIVYELQYAIEVEEVIKGRKPLNMSFPSDIEFYRHPSPLTFFRDILANFKRVTQREGWNNIRVVLLIDEFSYLFGKLVNGELSQDFMKNWKALWENYFFSLVLVGQDIMPKFKKMFSNEFGTTKDERVSYLKLEDANRLIDEPIRIGGKQGKSRYIEKAIERIVDLTDGSPFYIQIICDRLVEYMNSKRAPRVTAADVEQIKDDLIRGVNHLDWDNFDNLISSGDTSTNAISEKDVKKVLTIIAANSRLGDSCARNDINCKIETSIDTILDDLVERDVLECEQSHYYKIRVKLFKEWLIAHR